MTTIVQQTPGTHTFIQATTAEANASSNSAPQYFETALAGVEYEIDSNTGIVIPYVDIMNWPLIDAIKNSYTINTAKYNGSIPFTTMVYRQYGNTTLWRVVLAYNGWPSIWDIPLGSTIEFPNLTLINQVGVIPAATQIGDVINV